MNAQQFEYCRLNANGVLFYNKRPKKTDKPQLKNLTPGLTKTNGYLSPQSARQIRTILAEWSQAKSANFDSYGKRKPYFTFITLTLSSDQAAAGLSDEEIKRKCLNRFTQYLTRKGAKYLWKAEAQANGNIHFHIVGDLFLPVKKANAKWGAILADVGFKVDQDKFNGLDIEAARDPQHVARYIAKYFSSKDKDEKRRPIKGKLWGCSASLRLLKPYQVTRTLDPDQVEAITQAVKGLIAKDTFKIDDENFLFIGIKRTDILQYNPIVRHAAASYYSQIYSAIYEEEPNYMAVFHAMARSDLDLYQAKKVQYFKNGHEWHRHRWADFCEIADIRRLGFKTFSKTQKPCAQYKPQIFQKPLPVLQTALMLP